MGCRVPFSPNDAMLRVLDEKTGKLGSSMIKDKNCHNPDHSPHSRAAICGVGCAS
jgi:hypothetical protein